MTFAMERGDMQFVNNVFILHSRSGISRLSRAGTQAPLRPPVAEVEVTFNLALKSYLSAGGCH